MLYAQVAQIDGESKRNVLLAHHVMIPQVPSGRKMNSCRRPTPPMRDLIGVTAFSAKQVESVLAQLRLSKLTPLSVLAVELLPGDDTGKTDAAMIVRLPQRNFRTKRPAWESKMHMAKILSAPTSERVVSFALRHSRRFLQFVEGRHWSTKTFGAEEGVSSTVPPRSRVSLIYH